MPTSTNVTNLKINTLTKAQYDTAVQGGVIGPNELSVITDLDESIQVTTLPTASASELGKIYQFVGTTDANYTNGYFYKCVSDGQNPATYSWEQVDVQPNPDETHNKISHTFMYDEDNPISIANIRLKEGETARLKIRAYEAFDNGEGEIITGSELFNIDVFLDDAKYLVERGDSGNSRCLFSKLWNVGYLSCDISGTYDGYYQLWTQCYGEYEPDEKKYSIFEIEYSDGVDSFEFSAEEGGYIEVATGYTGLNPTGCRQEFPDFFEDYAPGGIMPVIEAGGTMTWKKYPFDDLYTGLDNQILVTESGGFANKWASQVYDMTMPEQPQVLLDPVAIFQYLGETNQDYTQGYFYKIAAVGQRNAAIISTQGSALGNITIDQDKFAAFLKSQGVYWAASDYCRMTGTSYYVSWEFMGLGFTKSELEDTLGISYDGYASNGDYIEIGWDDATFEWQQVNTQPEPVVPDPLPSQTGNAGKFLTTDGTDASWGNALANNATGSDSIAVGANAASTRMRAVSYGYYARANGDYCVSVGANTQSSMVAGDTNNTIIGYNGVTNYADHSIVIGGGRVVGANNNNRVVHAIQIGETGSTTTNADSNTMKVANANGNFEMMSADGTIPADRLPKAINKYFTMPTAAAGNEGWIVQFTGTTDATYTHGYIYECTGTTTPASTSETVSSSTMSNVTVNVATFVSGLDSILEGDPETYSAIVDEILDGTSSLICSYMDDGGGDVTWCLLLGPYTMVYGSLAGVGITYSGAPAEGDTITVDYVPESSTYAWQQTDVQPQGDSLPSQTGNSGKFLTTDGTDASWSDKPLVNNMVDGLGVYGETSSSRGIAIGARNSSSLVRAQAAAGSVAIGDVAKASTRSVAIGASTEASSGSGLQDHSIAIGIGAKTTATGAIQLGGSRTNVTATNSDANTFKVANNNGNYEIMSADGTVPTARLTKVNTAVTIAAADWNGGTTVTKTVAGVTATGVVLVSPDPTNQSAYTSAGIMCTAQAADSLTFTCSTTPTAAIDVNVVML